MSEQKYKTIEALKKVNKVFFDSATFHKDKSYSLIEEGEKQYLKVTMEGKKVAYYIVGDGGKLTYINSSLIS